MSQFKNEKHQKKWTEIEGTPFYKIYKNTDKDEAGSADKGWLLKIQKLNTSQHTPEQLKTKWNLINPNHEAFIVKDNPLGHGWISPAIEGDAPSDQELSLAVLDIFNKTGHIVVDAPQKNIFVKTEKGRIICVNIDFALSLEKRDTVYYQGGLIRKKSTEDLALWDKNYPSLPKLFETTKRTHPITVNTIKALLLIKEFYPDVLDVSSLHGKHPLIEEFATAYDSVRSGDDIPLTSLLEQGLDSLKKTPIIKILNLRDAFIKELEQYINSRGSVDRLGFFIPSIMTELFRDRALTTTKATTAQYLISSLSKTNEPSKMLQLIKDVEKIPGVLNSAFISKFKSSLKKCVEIAEESDSTLKPTL